MDMENKAAKWLRMDEEVWLRHANPWSGWTRFSALPLLCLAVWSRVWIGWWAVAPVILTILWIWLNPRLFGRPASTDHWISRAVFGERVWLNRKEHPIPSHHLPVIRVTRAITSVGVLFTVYGLARLAIWPTVFGVTLVFLGKSWFLDRMVWLYGEMRQSVQEYAAWLY